MPPTSPRTRRSAACAAAAVLLTVPAALTGCVTDLLAGGRGSATVSSSPTDFNSQTVSASTDVSTDQALAAAAAAMRTTTSAQVKFSTHDIPDLNASSYAAEITADPSSAKGSANLLIDGEQRQTDFAVTGGALWITNADGIREELGVAHGSFDPAAVLDYHFGLAALLESIIAPKFENPEPGSPAAVIEGRPTVKLTARLPVDAAAILLPRSSLAEDGSVPLTVWLDPSSGYSLVQLIATVGQGSMTYTFSPT